jgi:drug/metabolite transporter (DMT)-like permease
MLGIITREPMQFDLADVSARSIAGFVYLTTIGSLVGFTAYIWLLTVQPASRVSTYAYVNPVVAVFLGWALAGEAISLRTVIAAAIIIGAVALITIARSSQPPPPELV